MTKEEKREYNKRYLQTDTGKIIHNKCNAKYQMSLKGKIAQVKYAKTFKGKATHNKAQNKYHISLKFKRVQTKYWQSDKGKANKRKRHAKRKGLGFIPLNKYFEGSEGHHISENLIIYIPKLIHQSLYHSIWTWRNMEQMNRFAIEYLGGYNARRI